MPNYQKDYPRPQLSRNADSWVNLNGTWDFAFDEQDIGEKNRWYESFPEARDILVPFACETKMSGVGEEAVHKSVWYRRKITVDQARLENGRLLLHFEGCDYLTRVWVNGRLAGEHTGGYARFSFDVTDLAEAEIELVVEAKDSFDMMQPRGKQRWENDNFGCWYVQTTGIWKTVWMEYVAQSHIASLKLTPDLENSALRVEANVNAPDYTGLALEATVSFDGLMINRVLIPVQEERVSTTLTIKAAALSGDFDWDVKCWSPDHPDLYDLELRVLQNGQTCDEVSSYFGMREIRIQGDRILLNGSPLYQRLILDQGYWKDSHLTPPDEEALVTDIDKIMALGYNGVRKHQKTEDERFLYWCDVKGLLVWSEVPAAYRFGDDAVERFTKEWMEIVRQNYSHPCIITWTPFNESWGIPQIKTDPMQHAFTQAIYYVTKAFDPMRPVIVNDGWEHTISDIITLHDYEECGKLLLERYVDYKDDILAGNVSHNRDKYAFANGFAYRGQPVILSEFGGIAFSNGQEGWGYGNKVKDEKDFLARFDDITTAIKKLPYVCGYCYTQVSDVQQEINGLMDMDRNYKVDPESIREINCRETSVEFHMSRS